MGFSGYVKLSSQDQSRAQKEEQDYSAFKGSRILLMYTAGFEGTVMIVSSSSREEIEAHILYTHSHRDIRKLWQPGF